MFSSIGQNLLKTTNSGEKKLNMMRDPQNLVIFNKF